MEQDIRFKVYTFWDEKQSPEVKKFKMATNAITSFLCFRSKLEDIFPDLKFKKYSITWKDREGDDITISSDSDIQIAIEEYSPPVFKLYVYCQGIEKKKLRSEFVPVATTSSNTATTMIHSHGNCTNCNSPLIGYRYKCITCDNVELCFKCEKDQVHPDHCMIRVSTEPMIRDIKNAIKRSRTFLKTVAPGQGDKKSKRDRSPDKKRHGDSDERQQDKTEHKHSGHRSNKYCYCRPKKSWLDTFNNYINEFANLAGDIDINGNKSAEAENGVASDVPTQINPELGILKNETLKKVIYDSCEVLNKVKTELLKSQVSTTCDIGTNVDREDEIRAEVAEDVAKPSTSSKRDASPDQAGDWTVIENDLMDGCNDTSKPVKIGFNLPEEFRERVSIRGVENIYPSLNASTAVMSPQNDSKIKISLETKGNNSAGEKQEADSTAKEEEKNKKDTAQPIDPRFQSVIQSLLSMGFMGAQQLADLVEAYDGDISAVIDSLTSGH